MPNVELVVLGVASSAGAHHAGLEGAPAALRAAGLIDRLTAAGLSVVDRGDVVTEVFAVDHANPTRRHVAAVLRTARSVADAVQRVTASGAIPLVLGGDCTITLGVVAGVLAVRPDAALFYFDGDADLATPETTRNGVLDAMGIAHMLGLAEGELANLGGRRPLLSPARLVLFGVDETDPESFREQVLRDQPGLRWYPDHVVRRDPAGAARQALAGLSDRAGLIVHFDVDAIDSGDLPLANYPHYGTGVSVDAAAEALAVAAAAPDLAAIALTEVNPTHDPGGSQLRRYADAVGGASPPAFPAVPDPIARGEEVPATAEGSLRNGRRRTAHRRYPSSPSSASRLRASRRCSQRAATSSSQRAASRRRAGSTWYSTARPRFRGTTRPARWRVARCLTTAWRLTGRSAARSVAVARCRAVSSWRIR